MEKFRLRQLLAGSLCLLSLFAFAATSRSPLLSVNEKYRINKPKATILADIRKLDCTFAIDTFLSKQDTVYAIRHLKSGPDLILREVRFSMQERKKYTEVKILYISDRKFHNNFRSNVKYRQFKRKMIRIVETYVIEPIK